MNVKKHIGLIKREILIIEIFKHAEKIGIGNIETLYRILTYTTDKGIIKFHKDFLLIKT